MINRSCEIDFVEVQILQAGPHPPTSKLQRSGAILSFQGMTNGAQAGETSEQWVVRVEQRCHEYLL